MHHHAPISVAKPHLSLNAAQLFNALCKVERVHTQIKANGDMVSADSVHKLVKVAIADEHELCSATVQVSTLMNQLENRRVYEEFLVLIGFGSGRSNQVRSLLATQLPVPQYGNVSNGWRYSKYLRDHDFSFSHGRAFSFTWVHFIVTVELKPHQERNDSGDRPSFYGTLAGTHELRFGRTSAAGKRESDFGPEGFIRLVSRLCTVTASGLNRRPAARRSSASTASPFGLRFPASPDPPQMQSLALGSRAHFAY